MQTYDPSRPNLSRGGLRWWQVLLIVLGGVGAMAGGVWYSVKFQRKQAEERERFERMRATTDAIRARSLERIEKGEVSVDAEGVADLQKIITEIGKEGPGANAKYAKVANQFLQQSVELGKAWEAAFEKATKTELLAIKADDGKPRLIERREEIRAFLQASERLREHFEGAEARATAQLRAEGLNGAQVNEFLLGFQRGSAVFRAQVRHRTNEQNFLKTTIEIYDLLERTSGTWTGSPDAEISFEKDADIERFNVFSAQFNERRERYLKSEEELIEEVKKNGRGKK